MNGHFRRWRSIAWAGAFLAVSLAAGQIDAQTPTQTEAPAAGIPDDLIRDYLDDRRRLEAQQASLSAERAAEEARLQAITEQKLRRYQACTTRLSDCKRACSQQSIADALSSIRPDGSIDYSRQMAATSMQRECESRCEIDNECEALRP